MENTVYVKDGVPTVKVLNPNALEEYRLIDVRSTEEFTGELGHIERAELFTLGPDLERFLVGANKDEKILFICRSGGRSEKAARAAMMMGLKNVFNMEGGMLYWNAQGFKKL